MPSRRAVWIRSASVRAGRASPARAGRSRGALVRGRAGRRPSAPGRRVRLPRGRRPGPRGGRCHGTASFDPARTSQQSHLSRRGNRRRGPPSLRSDTAPTVATGGLDGRPGRPPGQAVTLAGRLDAAAVADVRLALHSAVDVGHGDLVVDIGGGAGRRHRARGARRRAPPRRPRGRRLVLRGIPPRIERLLCSTRLHRVLEVERAARGLTLGRPSSPQRSPRHSAHERRRLR